MSCGAAKDPSPFSLNSSSTLEHFQEKGEPVFQLNVTLGD